MSALREMRKAYYGRLRAYMFLLRRGTVAANRKVENILKTCIPGGRFEVAAISPYATVLPRDIFSRMIFCMIDNLLTGEFALPGRKFEVRIDPIAFLRLHVCCDIVMSRVLMYAQLYVYNSEYGGTSDKMINWRKADEFALAMSNHSQTFDWRSSGPFDATNIRSIQPQNSVHISHLNINRCFDDAPIAGGPNSKWRLERKNDFGEFPYDRAALERMFMLYCFAPIRNANTFQAQANYLAYLQMYSFFRRVVLRAHEHTPPGNDVLYVETRDESAELMHIGVAPDRFPDADTERQLVEKSINTDILPERALDASFRQFVVFNELMAKSLAKLVEDMNESLI